MFRLFGSALAASLLCLAAGASRAEDARAPSNEPAPLGSFERAGLAVFVRAHEARRHGVGLAPPPVGLPGVAVVTSPVGFREGGLGSSPELDLPSATGSSRDRRWVGPGDLPARPGVLAAEAPHISGPFGRPGLLGSHASPDFELEVTKRASIGLFGEANRIEPTDIRNATTRATRELGAGVTLQYRFGE